MELYEYYDDYDHLWEEGDPKRPRVRYVVLGIEEVSGRVVIFYPEHNILSFIGSSVHAKAWVVGEIDKQRIFDGIQKHSDFKTYQIQNIQNEIEHCKSNQKDLDLQHQMKPGHSSSSSMRYFCMTVHYKYGDSYTDKLIEKLEEVIRMLQVRDVFLSQQDNL